MGSGGGRGFGTLQSPGCGVGMPRHRLTLPRHVVREARLAVCGAEAAALPGPSACNGDQGAERGREGGRGGRAPARDFVRGEHAAFAPDPRPQVRRARRPSEDSVGRASPSIFSFNLIASARRWRDSAHLTEDEVASSERPGRLSPARQLRSAGRSVPVSAWPEAALSPAQL